MSKTYNRFTISGTVYKKYNKINIIYFYNIKNGPNLVQLSNVIVQKNIRNPIGLAYYFNINIK